MLMIRKAELKDLPAITDIYNEAILHTTATFDTKPRPLKSKRHGLKNTAPNILF